MVPPLLPGQTGPNDDVIDLTAFSFTAVGDLTITDAPGAAVIELAGSDSITLVGVDAGSLGDEDFLFTV